MRIWSDCFYHDGLQGAWSKRRKDTKVCYKRRCNRRQEFCGRICIDCVFMKSVASAPGKVILFGEHFVVYGIKAILCSIDKRITATSEIIDEKKIKIKSDIGNVEISTDSLSTPNRSMDVMKPFLYIAKKALEKLGKNVGIEIKIDSEIPVGIGLGSSSACCVAVTASVMGLFEKLPKEEILKIAIEAERTIFENTSGADCSVCTFGGLMEYDKIGRAHV